MTQPLRDVIILALVAVLIAALGFGQIAVYMLIGGIVLIVLFSLAR